MFQTLTNLAVSMLHVLRFLKIFVNPLGLRTFLEICLFYLASLVNFVVSVLYSGFLRFLPIFIELANTFASLYFIWTSVFNLLTAFLNLSSS